jgi:hypothetical protein
MNSSSSPSHGDNPNSTMRLAAGRASARAGRVGGRRSGKGRGDADWLKARTPVSLDELSSSRSAFSRGNGTSLQRQQTCEGAAPSVTRGRAGTGGAVAHLPKQAGGKSKTNKSAHKRFKITASGKVCLHSCTSNSVSESALASTIF